jgi:hypothetical protein
VAADFFVLKMQRSFGTGNDRAVMETCDDAAVSKLSAVQKGYYKVVIVTCSGKESSWKCRHHLLSCLFILMVPSVLACTHGASHSLIYDITHLCVCVCACVRVGHLDFFCCQF